MTDLTPITNVIFVMFIVFVIIVNFSQEHDRLAGRLILLDGATGKSIGRYLAMPGGLETYMSPVLHTLDDGSMYILFGHGGETVPGSILHLI